MATVAAGVREDLSGAAALSLLASSEYRAFLFSSAGWTLACRALGVVIAFQIYELTRNPLDLGWLGLVEAIPALTLVLYGGHFADRHDRRRTAICARGALTLLSIILVLVSLGGGAGTVSILLAISFLAGCSRAFADPAVAAFEGQIVARESLVKSGVMLGSAYQLMSVVGPAAAGIAYEFGGAAVTYMAIAAIFGSSTLALFRVAKRPLPAAHHQPRALQAIGDGIRYVLGNQILIGSMALDLLAVLFGGAIGLLPIFATDILKVGPAGFGLLNAAPAAGSLALMLIALRNPPKRHAGRMFFAGVAGFGCAMILFGLSENFILSLALLTIAGACDGLSVVIRRAITRLMAPDAMRGRVAAVSTVFIGSSNEIGAFESGVAATFLGTARSVWLGGVLTLIVVAITALKAPKLLKLDLARAEREGDV